MDALHAVGISIVSSLLTVLLLLIGKLLWHYWLVEYWLKFTCRHILDVSGKWLGNFQYTTLKVTETLVLKQSGWSLSETLECVFTEPNKSAPTKKNFVVRGICRGEIVTLYYWNPDRTCRGSGAIVVRLIGDGDCLEGYAAVYAVNSSDIESDKVTYDRQDRLNC